MNKLFKQYANQIIEEIVKNQKRCEAGGLPFLFWGEKVSEHSFYIKVGRNFEKWFKYVVKHSKGFELLPDGVTKKVINGKSKDIDLLIKNEKTKTIFYRELKSNLELDTEKLPATIDKVTLIRKYLSKTYKGYNVDCGILHWAVYDKNILPKKYKTKLKQCSESGVDVFYPKDLFETLKQNISEKDYHNMFKNIAKTYLIN